jgi:hypothetical protein
MAWAGVVESQLHLYGHGDAGELELVDCFATIAGGYDFAALGDDLFVLSDDNDADTALDLWRCTADGTQAEERIDDTEIGDTAWAFVEAAGSVLYLGLPDQLRRVDAGMRTSTRVATTTSPLFATDDRHAYVRTQDGITRVGDGDPVVIVPPHPHGDFAVAGEHLFIEDGWGHLVAFELPAASE